MCFGNNFSLFKNYELFSWGKLTKSENNIDHQYYCLTKSNDDYYEIFMYPKKIIIIEKIGENIQIIESKKFTKKWII